MTIHTLKGIDFSRSNSVVEKSLELCRLPSDIVIEIFKHLKIESLGLFIQLCKRSYQLFSGESIWQCLFFHHYPNLQAFESLSFQESFKNQYSFQSNLANGVCGLSSTLKGHKSLVGSLVMIDGKLFSGGIQEETIKVWDLTTNSSKDLQIGSDVNCLATIDGKLVAGYENGKIKVWDLRTKKCIERLNGHDGEILSLLVTKDGKLISASEDCTINIWDFAEEECSTLIGHEKEVCSLTHCGDTLFSESLDNSTKAWDLKGKSCKATHIQHSQKKVTALLTTDDGKFISAHLDNTIEIWDLKEQVCKATLTTHQEGIYHLASNNGILFSGSFDGTIKVWNLNTPSCLATLGENGSKVICLLITEDGKIIASFKDKTIKIWDFKASDEKVFQELADVLENGNTKDKEQAMQRFSKMPKTAKKKILEELQAILKLESVEFAGKDSTPSQKAQAIRNYLKHL